MPNILNSIGNSLFSSVKDKASDIGEKVEDDFSRLAQNITGEQFCTLYDRKQQISKHQTGNYPKTLTNKLALLPTKVRS